MSRTTFEVPQSRHPFAGLGTGIIVAENGKEEPKITIRFPLYGIEVVTAKGDDAKRLMMKMNSDEYFIEDRIDYIKSVACSTLGIDEFTINTAKKNERAVFARWLVWKYLRENTNLSLAKCGELFKKDHATVKHGIKKVAPDEVKYMSKWQQIAYYSFQEKTKDLS